MTDAAFSALASLADLPADHARDRGPRGPRDRPDPRSRRHRRRRDPAPRHLRDGARAGPGTGIGALAGWYTSDTVCRGVPRSTGLGLGERHDAQRVIDGEEGTGQAALSLAFLSSMAGGADRRGESRRRRPARPPSSCRFGSPELFVFTMLGVSLGGVVSRGNVVKGLTAGFLGLLLGMVGASPTTAEERFTFRWATSSATGSPWSPWPSASSGSPRSPAGSASARSPSSPCRRAGDRASASG